MKTVDTITISSVQSRSVDWLWESYIPFGTVTMLFGDGGQGKSFMSLAIAAAVTKGLPLPGSNTDLPPSDVIVQNAENPLPTVVKPRLEMLGADCNRIHIINESERRLTMTDERIETAIIQHNARLAIFDPVQSYLGDISMNRAESVRAVLTGLEQIAERTNCAILVIGHLNKGNGKASYRGLGSVDIFNSVPSVLYLGKTDDSDDVRYLVHGKSNFAELGKSQSFTLNKTDGFQWLGECDITLDDLLNYSASKKNRRGQKVEEAKKFLIDTFADGTVMAANEVVNLADEYGIKGITLQRAKNGAGVESKKVDGHWIWRSKN